MTVSGAESLAFHNRCRMDLLSHPVAFILGHLRQLAVTSSTLGGIHFCTAFTNCVAGIDLLVTSHGVEHIASVIALLPSANTLAPSATTIAVAGPVLATEAID